MGRWMVGGLVLSIFVVSTSLAHGSALQKSRLLEASLDDLKSIAQNAADDAAVAGNSVAEARRDTAAEFANWLSLELHKEVQRAIKLGQSNNYVRTRLKALADDFADLGTSLNQTGINSAIKIAYADAEYAWNELDQELKPQTQPLSATCVGKFGGNFFNKQTHVECTVNGSGAVSYHVQFSNNLNGQNVSAYAQGPLAESASQQTFSSEKVSVGNYADYEVYLYDELGNQHLVASGEAQGNPF